MPGSSALQPSELPANVPLFSRTHKVEITNLAGRGNCPCSIAMDETRNSSAFRSSSYRCCRPCAPYKTLHRAIPCLHLMKVQANKRFFNLSQATTTQGSARFVPKAERIASFDRDGALWVEHPMYTQVVYCLDRVPVIVKSKPELANVEPFKTILSGNHEAIAKSRSAIR